MPANDSPTGPLPKNKLAALTIHPPTNNVGGSGISGNGTSLAAHHITTLQTTITALETQVSALTATISQKDNKIDQVQTFITEMFKRSQDKDESIGVLKDQLGKSNRKVEELERMLEKKERRVVELEEDLEEVRGF